MTKITTIQGQGIPLQGDDIDTDRIIPARYLRTVTFEGLGKHAFHDERYNEDGSENDHPLNTYKGHTILLVNKNFGCGSSREHAPQSLKDYGIKAVIGESFAEIFAGNCTSLGIPTITLLHDDVKNLQMVIKEAKDTQININLETKKLTYGDFEINFDQNDSSNKALKDGLWDSTALLLQNKKQIEEKASDLPYVNGFE